MYDTKIVRIVQDISINLAAKKSQSLSPDSEQDAGFSLVEMVAVVLMVGVLAVISISGLTAFLNRQQVNKMNDTIFSALQTAQKEAKRKKVSYSVSFIKYSSTGSTSKFALMYAIYANNGATPYSTANWQSISTNLNTGVWSWNMASNLSSANTVSSSSTSPTSLTVTSTYPPTTQPPQTITFDYTGALDWQQNSSNNTSTSNNNNSNITYAQQNQLGYNATATTPTYKGLIISLQGYNIQRCVIVKTLLGTMQTGKDSQCN